MDIQILCKYWKDKLLSKVSIFLVCFVDEDLELWIKRTLISKHLKVYACVMVFSVYITMCMSTCVGVYTYIFTHTYILRNKHRYIYTLCEVWMIFGLFNQLQSNTGHVWHYMPVINENKTVQTQVRLIKWWVKCTLAFEKIKINIKSQLVLLHNMTQPIN